MQAPRLLLPTPEWVFQTSVDLTLLLLLRVYCQPYASVQLAQRGQGMRSLQLSAVAHTYHH
jgi:hypothetical protein